MPRNPRHDQILNLLQKFRHITVAELTERLGVSRVTIRKDLTLLEDMGFVLRSHGGARLAQSAIPLPPVSVRRGENYEEKNRIAEQAQRLIQDGDTVCLDAGSTNVLLAEKLVKRSLRVVTNSLEIVNIMKDSDSVALTVLGGNYRREGSSFIGPVTEAAVNEMQFDFSFIGVRGVSMSGAFLTQNSIEGAAKRSIMRASHRRVVLADSSKFHARAFSKFADADLVDILITDRGCKTPELIRELGIELIIV